MRNPQSKPPDWKRLYIVFIQDVEDCTGEFSNPNLNTVRAWHTNHRAFMCHRVFMNFVSATFRQHMKLRCNDQTNLVPYLEQLLWDGCE